MRIAVAVRTSPWALLVTAQVAARLVTLSPSDGAHNDAWLGHLWDASSRPAHQVRVRVTAFFSGRTAARMTANVPLSARF